MATKKTVKMTPGAGDAASKSEAQRVSSLIANINKAFGKNTIVSGSQGQPMGLRALSSGNALFDAMTGCGGIPRGRITEIFGGNSAGKTTILGHVIAETHARGGRVAYLEPENKLHKQFYQNLGVRMDDADKWHTAQDSLCEVVLPTARALVESELFDLVIVDSIASMGVRRGRLKEGEIQDDMNPRSGAGLERAALLTEHMSDVFVPPNTAYVFTNHVRVGMSGKTQPGGSAVKHAAALRIEVSPWWEGRVRQGSTMKCVKNQVGGKTYEPFDLAWTEEHDMGYDAVASYVKFAPEVGVLETRGAHYYWGDERIAQGWANAARWFQERPDEYASLKGDVDMVMGWER